MKKDFALENFLKELTIDFCECYLDLKRGNISFNKKISLYGVNDPILIQLKDSMKNYFKSKGKSVSVNLGKKEYSIDVHYFFRNIRR